MTGGTALSGRLLAAPGLRLRPVPEWDGCVVYDPGRRRLTELNGTAALALALLVVEPGRATGYARLRAEFGRTLGTRLDADETDRLCLAAVLRLIGAGLAVRRPDEAGDAEGTHDG